MNKRIGSVQIESEVLRKPVQHLVCREAMNGIKYSLHAVIEMVEVANEQPTHRSCLAGEGFKPPKGAVVKSHGAERLGKGFAMSGIRYG